MEFRISEHERDLFAKASFDRNPLHVDEAYAKKTPFRKPIAHGCLVLLKMLAKSNLMKYDYGELEVDFKLPPLFEEFYSLEVKTEINGHKLELKDGTLELVNVKLRYTIPSNEGSSGQIFGKWSDYTPDNADLQQILDANSSDEELKLPIIAPLVACISYITGMICPGKSALLRRINLRIRNQTPSRGPSIKYALVSTSTRFGLCQTHWVFGGMRHLLAECSVDSFELVTEEPALQLSSAPKTQIGKPQTAIVVGGGSGFGLSLAHTLVSSGVKTAAIGRSFPASPDSPVDCEPPKREPLLRQFQGDATSQEQMIGIREHETLRNGVDYLFLCATAPLRQMRLEDIFLDRISRYVSQEARLALVILEALKPRLSAKSRVVYASTAALDSQQLKQEMFELYPHYVLAKQYCESLLLSNPWFSPIEILRLPPMSTNLIFRNVLDSSRVLDPEVVAHEIVSDCLSDKPLLAYSKKE